MKFLCLCYFDRARFDALGPGEFDEIKRICEGHDRELYAQPGYAFVGSLTEPEHAATLVARDTGPERRDGAYAPTGEPLGAFFMVEAADLDAAVAIASLHPGAHIGRYLGGGIEVRACDLFRTGPAFAGFGAAA
jgi:hypothetical protein